MALDPCKRSDVRRGQLVAVIQKYHQQSGQLTEGVVKDLLTSAPHHHRGIKVRLDDGIVGRVQKILEDEEDEDPFDWPPRR
jgi:uncharacterized repeat protein (TIGR03833 family)